MTYRTIFSPCRLYRYTLWRSWPVEDMLVGECSAETNAHKFVQFIGLNPSIADEKLDDPTIRRCIGFAKAWGYGALCMTNLFAFRATKPKDMKRVENPVGIHNQHHLIYNASMAGIVIAAWGVHGTYRQQDLAVRQWMSQDGVKLFHLGLTKDGHPKHPLYLKSETKPTEWIL